MAKPARSVHEEEVTGRIFDAGIYARLLPFARPYFWRFAASVVLLLFLAAAAILVPLALKFTLDRIIKPDLSAHDPSAAKPFFDWLYERISTVSQDPSHQLMVVAGILVAAGTITFVCRLSQIWIANLTGQRIIYDVRDRVFQHIQRRNLRFFDQNPVGRLVTRVTSDIEAVAEIFTAGIDIIFYDLMMIGVTLGILFWLSPSLALMTLAGIPFVAAWSFIFKRQAQELFRTVRARVSRLNSYINECITGIRVIQVFGTEARTNAQFESWNRELREAHLKTVKNFSMFYPGVELFSAGAAAVILLFGHKLFIGGDITIGTMLAFWFLLHKFFEPLRQISEKYNVLQSAMASAERITRILDDASEIPEAANPAALDVRKDGPIIEFDHVRFSYDGRTEVLRDLSFVVQPGEKIAIVGHTGAGKTSIINILARFYDVQQGEVRVAGRNVREYSKTELRRAIGIVLQEVFLFADTLRENLRLGDKSISDASLMEACRRVRADRLISGLSGGLDHQVKERGASFSMGEKQLLAFARTLAHDPPILVLDEATANIDTQTEILIQNALEELMADRTVIVIAHRLSTIKKADRIIVMHHGELREVGTHAELLKADGLYRRLYELQYRSQETADPGRGA
ncbi:MAG: ABC transporter ATP-binding protein [Planctomycetota bacterium]